GLHDHRHPRGASRAGADAARGAAAGRRYGSRGLPPLLRPAEPAAGFVAHAELAGGSARRRGPVAAEGRAGRSLDRKDLPRRRLRPAHPGPRRGDGHLGPVRHADRRRLPGRAGPGAGHDRREAPGDQASQGVPARRLGRAPAVGGNEAVRRHRHGAPSRPARPPEGGAGADGPAALGAGGVPAARGNTLDGAGRRQGSVHAHQGRARPGAPRAGHPARASRVARGRGARARPGHLPHPGQPGAAGDERRAPGKHARPALRHRHFRGAGAAPRARHPGRRAARARRAGGPASALAARAAVRARPGAGGPLRGPARRPHPPGRPAEPGRGLPDPARHARGNRPGAAPHHRRAGAGARRARLAGRGGGPGPAESHQPRL
ncbi:MAG: Ribonuclease D, partial [uncultured Gemmatimonadetes bacterium]